MKISKKYDLICIGAGSGGLNVATFMNRVGFKVLLIDKSDKNIGGDCLNFGCVPSKALIHISRLISNAKESKQFGFNLNGKINIKKVMKYVYNKQEIIRKHENAEYFRKQGIDVELGRAEFVGSHEIRINKKTFSSKKIVLATGSRPRKLNIPGIDKVKFLTNENIFKLKNLPENLLVIGGGPIGIELGQAFSNLGSKVTIVQNKDQFLPREVPESAKVLLKKLKKDGIKFKFLHKPKSFISKNTVILEHVKSGKQSEVKFDRVLISIGRELNIDNLSIEKAGIKKDRYKLKVDKYLRTTNKDVLVCGDVAGSYQFTHAAELHAKLIINNFFSPFKKKLNNDHIAWVTYTNPEIATFGLNENQLKERNIYFEKISLNFCDDDRSIVDDYVDGHLMLLIRKNKILGGSMVSKNAGELVQELILAESSSMNINKFFNKIYPYPTATRINKKIIGNYIADKKITNIAKKIFKVMYARL